MRIGIAVLASVAALSGCAVVKPAAETPPLTQTVLFASNKAAVSAEYTSALGNFVNQFACKDGYNVVVEGHTDNTGQETYNGGLSEKRANAVRDVIVANGVPAGNITTAGFGEAAPVAPNDKKDGRGQNRRANVIATQMDGGCGAVAPAPAAEPETASAPSRGVPKYLYRNHGQEGNG